MIKSMTGFGKSECIFSNRKLIIEIKSLNSKFLDINTRIPNGYREKEMELRSLVTVKLLRGKVDFTISQEDGGELSQYTINKALAWKYFTELKDLASDLRQGSFSDYLPLIMRLPDIMVPAREQMSDQEWTLLKEATEQALNELDGFRIQEGASLQKEMEHRNQKILDLLDEITPYEKQRIENLKEKISRGLHELADQEDVDQNRFEQELVYYIDRLDITEESVRLNKHCKYFQEILNESESQGKKLAFIAQEMGREINTLGSKASDAAIQKIVVQMKDELEKIKEQLFNVL
ncbi:MAG: YicC/YloC family endoribonuclease [Bacteroidales bacterium]